LRNGLAPEGRHIIGILRFSCPGAPVSGAGYFKTMPPLRGWIVLRGRTLYKYFAPLGLVSG